MQHKIFNFIHISQLFVSLFVYYIHTLSSNSIKRVTILCSLIFILMLCLHLRFLIAMHFWRDFPWLQQARWALRKRMQNEIQFGNWVLRVAFWWWWISFYKSYLKDVLNDVTVLADGSKILWQLYYKKHDDERNVF
jgi:hypothetical protein